MRIVKTLDEVTEQFERASSEALTAFGNGSMFIETYVENPRHIEIQIMGDSEGIKYRGGKGSSLMSLYYKATLFTSMTETVLCREGTRRL